MSGLTPFQKKCEEKLVKSIADLGFTLANRRLLGETEIFIESEVDDLRLWIYEDEACVIGKGVERVFEKWDFETQDALIQAFVDKVAFLLQNRA